MSSTPTVPTRLLSLALATVLASSLLGHGEGGLPRVDMSRFRLAKILDKQSGMEYERDAGAQMLWTPCILVYFWTEQ